MRIRGRAGGWFLLWSVAAIAEAEQPIWPRGIGNGFSDDTYHAGISLGGGLGAEIFGGQREHDLLLGQLNTGWIFTDIVASDRWWGGNWELRGEAFGGAQVEPSRYLAGITPALRYHFATGTRTVPFIQGGAGVSVTDIRQRDLSTTFEFNLMIGAGANYFFTEQSSIGLEYRLFHLSNAGIELPNTGLNTHLIMLGFSRWF
jgi:lipid A 3-O-deacylase